MMKIYGLILAAGASSRMGMAKALLTLPDGSTLLSAQYSLLKCAGCEHIAIVVGANRKDILKAHGELDALWVENERLELGQFSSLQCGLGELMDISPPPQPSPSKGEGAIVVILPIDTVGVKGETIKSLIHAVMQNNNCEAFMPEHQGRAGHPVFITKKLATQILGTNPEDDTARLDLIISKARHKTISVDDNGVRNNINTRTEWKNYLIGL